MLRRILHALLSPLGWIALELLEWGLRRWAPQGLILRLQLPAQDPGLSGLQGIEACLARPWLRGVLVEHPGGLEAWSEASLQQLILALGRLRSRAVVCQVAQHWDRRSQWLSTVASESWLEPAGMVSLSGPPVALPFLQRALSRWGVQTEIYAAGRFKSLGESLSRRSPSQPHREALEAVLRQREQIWQQRMGGETSKIGSSGADFLSAPEALSRGWVQGLGGRFEALTSLRERLQQELPVLQSVSATRLERAWRRLEEPLPLSPRILVLDLQGAIHDSDQHGGISAPRVVQRLEALADSRDVRALVLSISSPGGSSLGSDQIWRALRRLRERMPVVASLQDLAASGGYYVASAADQILAHPHTVTGSVGVIAGRLILSSALARLGVEIHEIHAGEAALPQWFSSTPDQQRRLQQMVEDNYELFLSRVQEGRGLSREAAHAAGQGRIWSGEEALRLGLIDGLGGISDAVQEAARRSDLQQGQAWSLRWERPGRRRPWWRRLLKRQLSAGSPELRSGDLLMWLHRAPHQALALCPQLSEFRVEEDLLGWLRLLQRAP